MGAFHHQLQHETAHLAALAVFSGVVVENGHVAGPLQQAVEIVGIDGDLVVDGGQFVSLSDAMGNERRVVDAPGNIPLVAGKQQDMVEVEVSRLEDSHDLNAFSRFAMKWDAGLLDDLHGQALQGCQIYRQVAALSEVVDSVDQRVGPEQRLLEQRVADILLTLRGYFAQDLQKGLPVVADVSGIGMTLEDAQHARCASHELQIEMDLDE